jgi:hypothetical protein
MESRKTIVLVLKSGKDFSFRDVELIARHIHGKWGSEVKPRIICLWDKASVSYDLGNIEFIPLTNSWPGTWSRMQLYSPEMEQYRPFLYIDLDTAIFNSLEHIFDLIKDTSKYIALEDFWQKGELATPLVWFPAQSDKIRKVWEAWQKVKNNGLGFRMDYFLRKAIKADIFWQQLTNTIYDFKPHRGVNLTSIPPDANLVCFHGKPRIHEAAEHVRWVDEYVRRVYATNRKKVTVIIPYNKDRGFLQSAINSVPKEVQLLLSKGDGNWPENFNKMLNQAEGEYIRWLHEDDMLTENCIRDSINAIETQGVDFIHGNALELYVNSAKTRFYRPRNTNPTLSDLLRKNYLHSATLMYRREIFEELGGLDETLNTAEEYEFNLRVLRASMKLGYCNATLAYYRRHAEQKVRMVPVMMKMVEREQVRTIYR